MLFNILALISFFIILLLLNTLIGVFPSLMACLVRWKESVNLDASVQLDRDRDFMALTMILPFCLIVFRFGLYMPDWMKGIGDNSRLADNRNLHRLHSDQEIHGIHIPSEEDEFKDIQDRLQVLTHLFQHTYVDPPYYWGHNVVF